jgi:hypothetical protein
MKWWNLGRRPLSDVLTDTTSKTPLIVIAPKRQSPQDQSHETQNSVSNVMLELKRIREKLDDMFSIDIPMSEATRKFTSSFFDDLNIKHVVLEVDTETGESPMEQYPWEEGEHEAVGQPGCKRIPKEKCCRSLLIVDCSACMTSATAHFRK